MDCAAKIGMLSLLTIKNLALVDELVWHLDRGLVGVTGETGAGKSVIVGALKLVLGDRADKSLIRTGESACTVEAIFELPDPDVVNRVLEAAGVEPCEEGQLIIKRVIAQSSNRQFVNNSPVTLGVLKDLGPQLVDLHGPHEHQGLLSTERQLSMLDAYAGAADLRAGYREQWRQWKDEEQELERFRSAEMAGERELDLLRHQLDEIDAAEISADEEDGLESDYRRAANSTHLLECASAALGLLGQDGGGVQDQIAQLQRQCRELEKLDPAMSESLQGVDRAAVEFQELERELADYVSDVDTDPEVLARLEQRINTLETLKRKYGPRMEDVLMFREEVAQRLDSVENRDGRLAEMEAQLAESRARLDVLGEKLSNLRRSAAPRLAKKIADHLRELGFKQAAFELLCVPHGQPEQHGLEGVEFQFGPNPGEPLKPLRQIASSGEISRVMLSVKSALADQDATPLMVFDEIDANVGGEIARAVGEKMARLGERHQVVAITHFPQVAALAGLHFVVHKEVVDGRTCSSLSAVDGEPRIDEMVRMLGGGGVEVRAMAVSLLGAAG